ncbi:GRAM-like protein [Artemisia annua]|uniref:GRAM-like protein n=1 Tax=Artemisia annua TaxID=35608 RepID=A0A2U1NVQ8_ARTAN|nr:GRAM-like protein [Artemisia annua]
MEKNGNTKKNNRRTTNSFAYRVRDHVRMGSKLSETVKGKLRLGARIIQKGGRENIFKEVFGENDGEKLLKASQCYLSTTAGPIVGILFISTQKVAFCSDRSITLRSPNGDLIRKPYKLSETVKGKLRLGARIIQKGGRENIFKEVFGENDGEKLLKASQCYLSTTAGPIVGILFISTQKVAFCSDRSITLRSPNGDLIRKPYKVVIPTNKIKEANESENVENPSQKYIQIVTDDSFEFWFMGFVRYEKAFHNLRKALSLVSN